MYGEDREEMFSWLRSYRYERADLPTLPRPLFASSKRMPVSFDDSNHATPAFTARITSGEGLSNVIRKRRMPALSPPLSEGNS